MVKILLETLFENYYNPKLESMTERKIEKFLIQKLRSDGIYAHTLPDSSVGTKEFDFFFYFKNLLFLVELKKDDSKLRRNQEITIKTLLSKFSDITYVILRMKDGRFRITY